VLLCFLQVACWADATLFPVVAPEKVAFNYPEPPHEGQAGFFTIAEDAQARCVIVRPASATPEEMYAVELLQTYLQLVTGTVMPVLSETDPLPADMNRIAIGATQLSARIPLNLPQVQYGDDVFPNLDGYLVCTPDARTLIIHGATPRATTLGVTRFLKRYVGVRRFWPGKAGGIGDVVPKRPTLRVPALTWRDWPYLLSRELDSTARTDDVAEKARMNRPLDFLCMDAPLSTHHGYLQWMPPARYGIEHPEYYPLRNGKRAVPEIMTTGRHKGNYDPYWQPCVSNPEVVRVMADNIIDYFRAHPEEIAVSIAVNDGLGDCECEGCRAMDAPGADALTRSGFSDRYAKFDNAVAARVAQVFPDKILTIFAYGAMRHPPTTVALHRMLLPVLTINENMSTFAQWDTWMQTGARRLGIYQYHDDQIFFILPKMDIHQSAKRIRYLVASGRMRHFFQEFDSMWPLDGMIPHLEAELLWDPRQNPDTVLDDYYTSLFGPAAAPMRDFYAALESGYTRWLETTDIPHAYGKDIGNSSNRNSFAQFDALNPTEAEHAVACLYRAAELAKGDELVTRRIEAVRPLFEFAALGARVQWGMHALRTAQVTNDADARRILTAARVVVDKWQAWGIYLREVMQHSPATDYARQFRLGLLNNRNTFVAEVILDPLSPAMRQEKTASLYHPTVMQAVCAGLDAVADGLQAHMGTAPAIAWLQAQRAQETDPLLLDALAMAETRARGIALTNLVKDPGFEQRGAPTQLEGIKLAGATVTARRRIPGACRLTDAEAHSGTFSIAITNSLQGGLTSRVACREGERYHLSVWIKHNAVQANYQMEIQLSGTGTTLPKVRLPIPFQPGIWQHVSTDFIIPPGVNRLAFGFFIEQQGPGATIWGDDLFIGKYPLETPAGTGK